MEDEEEGAPNNDDGPKVKPKKNSMMDKKDWTMPWRRRTIHQPSAVHQRGKALWRKIGEGRSGEDTR